MEEEPLDKWSILWHISLRHLSLYPGSTLYGTISIKPVFSLGVNFVPDGFKDVTRQQNIYRLRQCFRLSKQYFFQKKNFERKWMRM